VSRGFKVKTPLGDDVLNFEHMTGEERMGQPFHYEVSLLSTDPDLDLSSLLGKAITLEVELPESKTRYFSGYVAEFAMENDSLRHVRYRATLRPWLWLLSLTSTSRIFQNKTVPEIVKEIFRARGFTDFREELSES